MDSEQQKITSIIFPLINFVTSIKTIELSSDATIREAWPEGAQSRPFPATHLIEVLLPEPILNIQEGRAVFDRTTAILKLFKNRLVYSPTFWGKDEVLQQNVAPTFWVKYYIPWEGFAPYELSKDEVDALQKHWETHQDISEKILQFRGSL